MFEKLEPVIITSQNVCQAISIDWGLNWTTVFSRKHKSTSPSCRQLCVPFSPEFKAAILILCLAGQIVIVSLCIKVHEYAIKCLLSVAQTNRSPHPPAAAFIWETKSGCGSLPADSRGRGWKVDYTPPSPLRRSLCLLCVASWQCLKQHNGRQDQSDFLSSHCRR